MHGGHEKKKNIPCLLDAKRATHHIYQSETEILNKRGKSADKAGVSRGPIQNWIQPTIEIASHYHVVCIEIW